MKFVCRLELTFSSVLYVKMVEKGEAEPKLKLNKVTIARWLVPKLTNAVGVSYFMAYVRA